MNVATIIGILLGLTVILYSTGDQRGEFLELNPFLIVALGTLAATLVNYPMKKIMGVFKVVANVFKQIDERQVETLNSLVKIATIYKRDGIRGIENHLKQVDDSFLHNGIEMITIEKDEERFRGYLTSELENMINRHTSGQEMFYNMGAYAPAFGLLGTVIGLILMMINYTGQGNAIWLNDQSTAMAGLLKEMGFALKSTFYGIILSNLFFNPIAGKLKNMSDDDVHIREMMVEGLTCIFRKEHPILVRDKLLAYLPLNLKVELMKKK